MLNLISSSLNPFSLAFRQGGINGKWGLWLYINGNDFLVNPETLAKTIGQWGDFPNIFFHEFLYNGEPLPLPFRNLRIREAPWTAPSFVWELEAEDGRSMPLSFDKRDYMETVYEALKALYCFHVINGQDVVYDISLGDLEELFTNSLTKARRGILMVTRWYHVPQEEQAEWNDLDLRLPVEPFQAVVDGFDKLVLRIGGRTCSMSLEDMSPDEFRHNLEHLVFHDNTSFGWVELYAPGTRFTISLQREWLSSGLGDRPVLMIHEEVPSGLIGFCYESEVVSALAKAFRKRYPGRSLGGPLKGLLSIFQGQS